MSARGLQKVLRVVEQPGSPGPSKVLKAVHNEEKWLKIELHLFKVKPLGCQRERRFKYQ
jgi:hypothetical protein